MRFNNEKRNDLENLKKGAELPETHFESPGKTSIRLGKEYDVSRITIERDAHYAQGLAKVAETMGDDVRAGKKK